jgi:hypothetical protein
VKIRTAVASIISAAILSGGGVAEAVIALQGEGSKSPTPSCATVVSGVTRLLEGDARVRRFYAQHPGSWRELESPADVKACGNLQSLIRSLTAG